MWEWERRKGWEPSGPAARSWELFEEDLRCAKELNLNAYRFSVEWSRVEPEPGRFDAEVLERYALWARRLSQEGIRPFVCLHHFSEPAWLLRDYPRGWMDERVPGVFLRYVRRAARDLGTVNDWLVFNEPVVFLVGAYGFPHFPPGGWMLLDLGRDFNPVLLPRLARTYNEAARLLRALKPGARVGIAHHVSALEPAGPGEERAVQIWDWFMHRHFLDLTAANLDFLGINYYTRIFVRGSALPGAPMGVLPGYAELEKGLTPLLFRLLGGRRGAAPRNSMGWEIVPEALEGVLLRLSRAYGRPILVTENGLAASPAMSREEFIRGHVGAVARAREKGADVRGYFHWSLLDNYEWGSYGPRFGLFSRDRRPAQGAAFYAELARAGRLAAAA